MLVLDLLLVPGLQVVLLLVPGLQLVLLLVPGLQVVGVGQAQGPGRTMAGAAGILVPGP